MKKIEKIIHTIYVALVLLFIYCPLTAGAQEPDEKSAEAYKTRIAECFDVQDWNGSKQLLDEALELYPDESELNRLAGTYFLHQKETENARYFLIKAVKADSDNRRAKLQLISLEEESGNISSAICYVNELLELYPYDKALWKRKIGLYRKQGNQEEADRLLKRLHRIFPTDSILNKDYLNRMEENYLQQRKAGQKEEAVASLKELLKHRNNEPSYYIDLSNLLLQQGYPEEALAVISSGINVLPGNETLLKKKAEILSERGNSMEAYNLVRNSRTDSLREVADRILMEAARKESWKDPYILYGRIYESQKSAEALDYLLRTSFSRGYDEDALYYLGEAAKRYGTTPDILYRKYRIYTRTGDERAAIKALEQLVETDRRNEDMCRELVSVKLQRADELMSRGLYDEALADIGYAARFANDEDQKQSVLNRMIDCYAFANRNERLLAVTDSIRRARNDATLYAAQRATALEKMNRRTDALAELERQPELQTELYEAIATRHIKELLEAGAVRQAYAVSKEWLDKIPASKEGLQFAVRTSGGLRLYEEEEKYIGQGRQLYPQESFFVLKEAGAMYRKGEYRQGMELLSPWVDSLSGNKELTDAYIAHAALRAEQLLKEKETRQALEVLNGVLALDSTTIRTDLYNTLGEAYEQAGDYRAAYAAYSRYSPPAMQMSGHKRKLMAVQRKGYKNRITTEFLTGWYAGGQSGNSVESVSYSRKEKRDLFTGTVNWASRNSYAEAEDEAGTVEESGVQFKLNWGHTFNEKWSAQLELGAANRFFPKWSGQVAVYRYLPKDIELGAALGYRKSYYLGEAYTDAAGSVAAAEKSSDMYNLKLTGTLYRDMWRLNADCDGYLLNSDLYFNLSSQIRFYPTNDGETHLLATLGAGTAPEADFIDKMMPGSFDKLNVTLGVGGVYAVSKHLSVGLMASYYHFYSQTSADGLKVTTNYKDLYNIYAQLCFCF